MTTPSAPFRPTLFNAAFLVMFAQLAVADELVEVRATLTKATQVTEAASISSTCVTWKVHYRESTQGDTGLAYVLSATQSEAMTWPPKSQETAVQVFQSRLSERHVHRVDLGDGGMSFMVLGSPDLSPQITFLDLIVSQRKELLSCAQPERRARGKDLFRPLEFRGAPLGLRKGALAGFPSEVQVAMTRVAFGANRSGSPERGEVTWSSELSGPTQVTFRLAWTSEGVREVVVLCLEVKPCLLGIPDPGMAELERGKQRRSTLRRP